jgi:DNA ligase-1
LEYKYDGERAQIHKLANGKIQVYSRNSEDNTSKYPDVIERLASFKLDSYILDAEIVAYDVETHSILPFQTLSTRKRKDASQDEIKVQVAIFAFDLLFLNGKSIMDQPLKNRRDLLHRHFDQTGCHYFFFASYKDMENKSEVESYMKESINNKCEGLMVKQLMDPYVPNKRSWFKIKKDYVQGITDTLDLVPIGGFYGKGKRTGVYGAFLLACYYKQNGMFQSITKIGTGFSDEDLDNHFKTLSPTVIKDDSQFQYSKKVNPDVWFRPTQVWEVLAADLSLSPVHMAACGRLHKTKGIALRFPRFIRVRDDKSVHDATDSNQVLDMFTNQKNQ